MNSKKLKNSFEKIKQDFLSLWDYLGDWISKFDAENRQLRLEINRLSTRIEALERSVYNAQTLKNSVVLAHNVNEFPRQKI